MNNKTILFVVVGLWALYEYQKQQAQQTGVMYGPWPVDTEPQPVPAVSIDPYVIP